MSLQNYKLDRIDKYKLAFFIIFALVSLFTSEKELLIPFYFRISSTTLLMGVFILFFILLILYRRFSLDFISIMLLVRVVTLLIPLTYTEIMQGYWGNYLAIIGSFMAYLISSQISLNWKKDYSILIQKVLMIFLNIASIQVIFMYFTLGKEYGHLNINLFKFYLVTPIGASNYIASIILPLLIITFYIDIKKKYKVISIILATMALVIIQSKNAIFVLLLFIAYRMIKKYIIAIKETNENKKLAVFLKLHIFITGVAILYLAFNYLLVEWNMGMVSSNGSIYNVINALSSNRLNVYLNELFRWKDHLLLGNGLAYETGLVRSHNWLIELLVQSGLFGLILYLGALVSWYKRINLYLKSSKLMKAVFYGIIIIFIQGLAEVSVFTLTVDVILWFLIGLSISESKILKHNKISN